MIAQKSKKNRNAFKIHKDELLALYLKEVGKIKRLTQKEIEALIKIISDSDKKLKYYFKKYKLSGTESPFWENRKLPEKIKEKILMLIRKKEKAKEELIKGNLRLVIKIAQEYKTNGISLLDLINEGNIGLIEGIERYDIAKGTKLSTYVAWWIKQKINFAILEQAHPVRLPRYIHKILKRCKQISEKLTAEIGYPPTTKQIAERVSLPINKLIEILQYTHKPVSLEIKVNEAQTELKELIEDKKSLSPFEVVYYISLLEKLEQIINSLKYNEQVVLKMRFGLFGNKNTHYQRLEDISELAGKEQDRF